MLAVEVKGLPDFVKKMQNAPIVAERAASLAINSAARRARTMAVNEAKQQVNLPVSYLRSKNGGINVTRNARKGDLTAVVSGRRRPVMLSRFVTGWANRGAVNRGAKVRVRKGGSTKLMKRSFAMNLKGGNVGLVVRTNGEKPFGAYKPLKLNKGKSDLWLLYGPSTDQVFNTIREDIAPAVSDYVSSEFTRQFDRLIT